MVLGILALVKWLKCKDCYKNNGLAIPGLLFTGLVLFSFVSRNTYLFFLIFLIKKGNKYISLRTFRP